MTLKMLTGAALAGCALLASGAAQAGFAIGADAPRVWSPRLERRVLEELTPAQVEAFAAGADPASLLLTDGETLEQVFTRAAAEADTPLAYTPLDPCILARTAGSSSGALAAGELRAFRARGDLSNQGGAYAGCGVPEDARVLAVTFRLVTRGKGSLHIWPAGDSEPGFSSIEFAGGAVVPALVELCHGETCTADFQIRALTAGTHLLVVVAGYFAPLELAQGPKGDPGPKGDAGPKGDVGPSGPPGRAGGAGSSCTVTTAADTATLSCPDGSTVSWLIEEASPPPPPGPVRSFQVQSPEIDVPAGTESTYCYYFHTPNTETVGIAAWRSLMSQGVHDLRVFTTVADRQPPGTMTQSPCGFGGGQGTDVANWVYAAYENSAELAFPSDDGAGKPLARELAAGTPAYIEIHFLNASQAPIKARVTLDAEALAPGIDYTKTHTYVAFNGQLSIPPIVPGGNYDVESETCEVPAGTKFWRLSMHTHKRAVHTAVKDGATPVFESTNWEHPGATTFAGPSFVSYASGELTYECTYDNPGNVVIQTGDSAEFNELCVAVGYFFPATKALFCYNDFLVPF
jgi:hypothetical protein